MKKMSYFAVFAALMLSLSMPVHAKKVRPEHVLGLAITEIMLEEASKQNTQPNPYYQVTYNMHSLRCKGDIDRFANTLKNQGIYYINFGPQNQAGSMPMHLREYAYFRMRANGIVVQDFRPTNHCYTMSYNGTTVYIDRNGRLYTHKYSHRHMANMAQLARSMQLYTVYLVPEGQGYGVPYYTRNDAYNIFAQYGIVAV